MTRARSPQAGSQPRTGLLLALVLAVLAAMAVQSLLNALIVERDVLRDSSAEAAGSARGLERRFDVPPERRDDAVQDWLAGLVAAPEVMAARVVGPGGEVVAAVPPQPPGTSAAALWDSQDDWPPAAQGETGVLPTDPSARWVGDELHVTVPLARPPAPSADARAGGAALQVVFDRSFAATRAGVLQRRLVAVVGAGGMLTIGLWVLLAGRGFRARRPGVEELLDGIGVVPAATATPAPVHEPLDELTGLPGRRTFIVHLERAVAWADETGEPLALALLDVNEISTVRDADGRRTADSLLRRTGEVLLTGPGLPYRVACDGFAVLFAGISPVVARAFAEGIAGDIAQEAAPLSADVAVVELDPVVAPDSHSLLIRAETELADARERRAFEQAHLAVGPEHLVPRQPERWDTRWLEE